MSYLRPTKLREDSECRLQTSKPKRAEPPRCPTTWYQSAPATGLIQLGNSKLSLAMDCCAIPLAFSSQPQPLTFALGQLFRLQLCEFGHSRRLRVLGVSDLAPIADGLA